MEDALPKVLPVLYEWLVVAGPKAQFKGTGMLNGTGSYGFMLTARDGEVNGGDGQDRFRMKVWERATGAVVYDNEVGAADDAEATTALGGGSIVIHGPIPESGPKRSELAGEALPDAYALEAAYPNPFQHGTSVRFALPEPAQVSVVVYDGLGREVGRLADGEYGAGRHTVHLDGSGLASGLYVVRLRAGAFQQVQRLTLMR